MSEESLIGKRFLNLRSNGLEARVMAETEGYLMVRHKGCMPFVITRKDFVEKFEEIQRGEGMNSFQ